jgi:HD superfamily phosphohydrolase
MAKQKEKRIGTITFDFKEKEGIGSSSSPESGQSDKSEKDGSSFGNYKSVQVQETSKAERQELFIPISGFVWLYPEEVQIVNHPTFQRLGRIFQLGQVYLVYRGATHKRIEHSLGTLHIVQRMIDAIKHTSERAILKNQPCGAFLQESEERFIRLGALLHDIGHIAAGHTVEDELCLINRHDSDQRLDVLFVDKEKKWVDRLGRSLGQLIDSEFSKYVPEGLLKKKIKASTIIRLLIRKAPDDPKSDQLQREQEILEKSDAIRLDICRDIIGNTICADLLDYLHRDWYHVGKPRTFDERILQYMEIRSHEISSSISQPVPKASDEFVIYLGKRPKVRTDAVSAILELLEWRYQLAESVLFHRTKLAAAAMLDRALYELWGDNSEDVEEILLPLSDEQMLAESKRIAQNLNKPRGKIAAELLIALERRELFTTLCTYSYEDLPSDVRARIQQEFVASNGSGNLAPSNRVNVLRVLENDFELPPGSLAMYCPTAGMNAKIAGVKIAVGNEIKRFCDYEEERDNQLSGGHLGAQLVRFQRLWKVHFFIRRDVKERISDYLGDLKEAILKLALGHLGFEEKNEEVTRRLAVSLVSIPNSPWYGSEVHDRVIAGAYQQDKMAFGSYPFGGKSIRSYIKRTDEPEA